MNKVLGVGQQFPGFDVTATVSTDTTGGVDKAFANLSYDKDYKGKWLVLFFYPKDFTFVCPTEIKGFGDLYTDFKEKNCEVLTASVDSEFVHLAWRNDHKDLKDLPFPMLADVKRELSTSLGILDENEGVSQRATFIIDPEGIVRHISINDLNVGRNPAEVLRVLEALQTNGLCGCNWKPGEDTLKV